MINVPEVGDSIRVEVSAIVTSVEKVGEKYRILCEDADGVEFGFEYPRFAITIKDQNEPEPLPAELVGDPVPPPLRPYVPYWWEHPWYSRQTQTFSKYA